MVYLCRGILLSNEMNKLMCTQQQRGVSKSLCRVKEDRKKKPVHVVKFHLKFWKMKTNPQWCQKADQCLPEDGDVRGFG